MNNKKAYIGLGISGQDLTEAKKKAEAAKVYLTGLGYDAKTPFDIVPNSITDKIYDYEQKLNGINRIDERIRIQKKIDVLWAKAMGKCLEYLVTCGLVYLLHGWTKSKGATIEGHTAVLFNIRCETEGSMEDITIEDLKTKKVLGHVAV